MKDEALLEASPNRSDAEILVDLATRYGEVEIKEITEENSVKAFAILPEGKRVESLKPLIDEFRTRPARRKGTASILNETSFTELTNRFKDENSALYADLGDISNLRHSRPKVTAIFDYHEAGGEKDGKPRFGEHRAVYSPPLSEEFLVWLENSGVKMTQSDFAEFIEDHISDIFAYEPASIGDDKLAEYAKLTGGTFASPSRLMELSKGLEIHQNAKVVNKLNLSTGETQVVFEEQHEKSTVVIPNMFLIAVPVFETGVVFSFIARLRYRVVGGSLEWTYILHKPEKVLKHAFEEACFRIRESVNLPLFNGTPER